MRITYKADYALKTMLNLAINYGANPVSVPGLARRLDIPIKFLEQILAELKKGGFVESRRGNVGGYFLSKDPSQITLGEVVRFIVGSTEPIACVRKTYSGCKELSNCVFRDIWFQVNEATNRIIDRVNFEELAKKAIGPSESLVYQI
ncbi:MAG: Rrf2 family transcriptional regulator [Candidatus Omnitrophota bacterium]|jgi:Rrf2 family protein